MIPLQKGLLLIRELGLKQLLPYAAYQVKLRTGFFRRATPTGGWRSAVSALDGPACLSPFSCLESDQFNKLELAAFIAGADEVLHGRYHPFGGPSAPLTLALAANSLDHWTHYIDSFAGEDIKFTWEPARFTWVYSLAVAGKVSGDAGYAERFWKNLEQFTSHNPVNSGPNWSSAQEVALRLLPMLFAWQCFENLPSTTKERVQALTWLVEQSARRISATLDYARSQNNNHLLSEALGLIMAGTLFSGRHPLAKRWTEIGFGEFEHALLTQVEPEGTYSQHSTNYHRMILQLSLVYYAYAQKNRRVISKSVLGRLAAATHWLEEFTDPVSGSASNLGHNDGTFLLPFGASDYGDVRPTLQAASLAFLHHPAYPPGPWDALALVLGIPLPNSDQNPPLVSNFIHSTHRVGDEKCWGTLRAVTFHSRPAHADQLAVDLWWEGVNIALDAGSYLYNAPPPWDNALARTCVHNTVSIDGQDQMLRTGRFLWLKWTNAQYTPQTDENSRSAFMIWRTDPPIRHIRNLTFLPGKGFKVVDELIPIGIMKKPGRADLHWLLPDWGFKLVSKGIFLDQNDRSINLEIAADLPAGQDSDLQISLVRAGETIAGTKDDPTRGWYSPTYCAKIPALSMVVSSPFSAPLRFVSTWKLNTLSPK